MNKVILSGNLTRDPEVSYTQSGKAVAKMGIAVHRTFSRDTTDFFNLTAWEKTAEFCGRYMRKGSSVIVEGRLQNDHYEKDGVKHYSVQIQVDTIEFVGSKRATGSSDSTEETNSTTENYPEGEEVDVPF